MFLRAGTCATLGVLLGCDGQGSSTIEKPTATTGNRKRLDLLKSKAEQAPKGRKS